MKPAERNLPCEVCGERDHYVDNLMFLCDTCAKGWHNDCLEKPVVSSVSGKAPDIWRCDVCLAAWQDWSKKQAAERYLGLFDVLLAFEPPAYREVHPVVVKVLEALDDQQAAEAFVSAAPFQLDAETEPKYKELRALVKRLLELEANLKKPGLLDSTLRLYLASDSRNKAPKSFINPLDGLGLNGLVMVRYDTPRRFVLGSVTKITAANGEEPATVTFDLMIPRDCRNGDAEVEFREKWESGRFQHYNPPGLSSGKVSLTVPQSEVLWSGKLTAQGKIYARAQKGVQLILGALKVWTGDANDLRAFPVELEDD